MKAMIEELLCRLFPLRLPGRVEGWADKPTPAWIQRRLFLPGGHRDRSLLPIKFR